MKERCRNYVGVAYVDGSCPSANREEYEERYMPVIKGCSDCFYYRGCVDCALADTQYCIMKREGDIGIET